MLRLSILCFLNYCFLVFEDLMNLTGSTHPTNTSPGYLPKYILAFRLPEILFAVAPAKFFARSGSPPHLIHYSSSEVILHQAVELPVIFPNRPRPIESKSE